MYFQKIRHPSNFSFAEQYAANNLQFGNTSVGAHVRDLGDDVFHVELRNNIRWPLDPRLNPLNEASFSTKASSHQLSFNSAGTLKVSNADGNVVLSGIEKANVGVCGSAWLIQFDRTDGMRFYGQGEKTTGLEKSGKRTKFWNLDVWADHPMPVVIDGQADPLYVAIPYLLIRRGKHWIGILVDHPGSVFMDTGSNWFFTGKDDLNAPSSFWFGADQGIPAFYLIAGTSPASVTQRLQRLVGATPLPPLWSLGHHQCRWGYKGTGDLNHLDESFAKHEFPCDGLWLDIDYMDRYKVFTTSQEHFGDRTAELKALEDKGRRIVPIIDPGVKVEAGYEVAESGLKAGIFCQNPEGKPYVGFVWPGRTWFPDFSLEEGRKWWAGYARQFREWGFHGAWLDMNDPSTGAAELDDMRFQHGKWDHWTYHNIYATGMAQASFEGFREAKPDERPFLLARSGATGSSRWTAIWTGDNYANWHHLRTAIHCTLNLALSGIPFNGPDVPGFGGHTDKELAIAWYKAGMLFPFLRNHALLHSTQQEPWMFGEEALQIIRHYVRTRYKLLPYLYQQWIAQEEHGTAVMRPLFHDFDNIDGLELDFIDDQFLIGPALMQAPLVQQNQQHRAVALPQRLDGLTRWMDGGTGEFVRAGRCIQVTSNAQSTPLYLQEGHIIPMQTGERKTQKNDLSDIELHVILGADSNQEASLHYVADDGQSYGYQRGARSACRIKAWRTGNTLHIAIDEALSAWKPLSLRVVAYDGIRIAEITTPQGSTRQLLSAHEWAFSGKPLKCVIGDAFTIQ